VTRRCPNSAKAGKTTCGYVGQATGRRHGHQGSSYGTMLVLAKRLCRTTDRIYPTRMFGSSDHYRGGTSAPRASRLRRLLQSYPHSPVFEQRHAIGAANSAGRPDQIYTSPWRSAPFIRPDEVCGRDRFHQKRTVSWQIEDCAGLPSMRNTKFPPTEPESFALPNNSRDPGSLFPFA